MQSNGSGLTFSDSEVLNAKRLLGLLNKANFNLSAVQMIEGARALDFLKELIPNMEANVFEVLGQVKAPEQAVIQES